MTDPHYYEMMVLLDSNRYAADANGVTESLNAALKRAGAEVVLARPWQENKLAYPVDGHRKGLYFLVYYSMDPTASNELVRLLGLNENVLRHIVIVHPKHLFDAMVEAIQSHTGVADEGPAPEEERGERRERRRREPRPAEA